MNLERVIARTLSVIVCASLASLAALAQGPRATNAPGVQLNIDSVIATPSGIRARITGENIQEFSFNVDRLDKTTGNFLVYIYSIEVPATDAFRGSNAASDDVNIPIIVAADSSVTYQIHAWGSPSLDKVVWTEAPAPKLFQGYSTTVTDSIGLDFSASKLTISAKTTTPVTLKAGWQVSDGQIDMQASERVQNPSLPIDFSNLKSPSGKGLPALRISLEDPNRGIIQEARITLSVTVAGDKTTKDQVQAIQAQPSSNQSNNTKFSWKQLAQTGLGAIIKYFAVGI
jgi:hypothetical protein